MKKIGDKFTKDTKKVISLAEINEEATTSRRVFPSDYQLLREMAFKEDKTITQILDDVFEFIKPKVDGSGLSFLPEVNDKTKSSTHKAVRLSVEFNDYLNKLSENVEKLSSKKLLSACLLFYIKNR